MIRNVTCKTSPVSRGKGHSAIAGAAYRAGENLKARGQGTDGADKWFRYGNRAGTVREAFIMTPEGAPDYAMDRTELWNMVEEIETHKKARLGREVQLGLAYELTHDEHRELVREFAKREFVDRGFVVDVAIHNYGRSLPAIGATDAQAERIRELAEAGIPFVERDEADGLSDAHVLTVRNRDGAATGYKLYQPHAHIRVTPRVCEDGEFVKDKAASRELNKHETAMGWRYQWPEMQNGYLERAGAEVRVSSTSADEDAFPDLRLLGRSRSNEEHSIAQRADAMHDQSRNTHEDVKNARDISQEFNEIHNSALQRASTDAPTATDSETERETLRTTTWWRNMSARFSTWRDDFADKAEEWRERFKGQDWRLKSVFGWHDQEHDLPPPEPSEPPEPNETPQQEEPER